MNFGDGTDSTLTSAPGLAVEHVYKDTGTYDVTLIVCHIIGTDSICDTVMSEVLIKATSIVDFTGSNVCMPDSTMFRIITDTTDLAIRAYSWKFGDPWASGSDISSKPDPSYLYTKKGKYHPSLWVVNADGCRYDVTREVMVYKPPVAGMVVSDSVCERQYFSAMDSSILTDAKTMRSWFWNFSDSATFTVADPSYKYWKGGDYKISLRVTDDNGCHDTISKVVHVQPSPISAYTIINGYNGKEGQIKLNNLTTGGTTYNWDFGNGKFSTEKDPVATFTEDGNYTITLVSQNDYCSDSTFFEYKLLFKGLYVPNAFAPSSTNLGIRLFQPIGINLKQYHVMVFDSWGHLMWESNKLDDKGVPTEGWDGIFEGNLMPQGNYIWKISALFWDDSQWEGSDIGVGKSNSTMGTVTLIR